MFETEKDALWSLSDSMRLLVVHDEEVGANWSESVIPAFFSGIK